jgi:hypothetical protein
VTQDANDLLMGSGAITAKFLVVGTVVTGTVLREPEARQQTDYRTKLPETWKDGSPKMMVVVQLATALRDPEKPDDDGTRALYIAGKNLTNTIRDAVRASGANGIHTGGQLTVQYVADGPTEPGQEKGPKLYVAQYVPPAVSFTGVTAPTAQQAAQPAQQYAPGFAPQPPFQAPQAPAQPAPQAAPASVAASVLGAPAGVDPNVWARLDPEQRQRVVAAMGTPVTAGQPGY